MLAVTAHNSIVVADNPLETAEQFKYRYIPYATGIIDYTGDVPSNVHVEIDEDSSLATMIASEEVLARDWDTPEEDEAWANL